MTNRRGLNIALENAKEEIANIKKMIKRGGDFHNMLLQGVLLTQIDYRISDLNRIQAEARHICQKLNEFSKTGTIILN